MYKQLFLYLIDFLCIEYKIRCENCFFFFTQYFAIVEGRNCLYFIDEERSEYKFGAIRMLSSRIILYGMVLNFKVTKTRHSEKIWTWKAQYWVFVWHGMFNQETFHPSHFNIMFMPNHFSL